MSDRDVTAAAEPRETTVVNPATGEDLARIPSSSPQEVDEAVRASEAAFRDPSWRRLTSHERAAMLFGIATAIRRDRNELAELETRNVGKPLRESLEEVSLAADCFEYYAGTIDKCGGQTIPVSAPGFSMTFREPIGVCALIVPWNFPIAITSWKV
ncbi:MAG TPA: aldehyde dehydrogenase family protein, partial [Thermoanaerobaculia bacterium]|nr:aldehyde dehydrogenase family protein [Thermoanaerobaculia bacterium]